jgi:hypothetical protein
VSKILLGIFKWLARQATALLFILAILFGLASLKGELERTDEMNRERAKLAAQRDEMFRQVEELKRSSGEMVDKAKATGRTLESILDQRRAERSKLSEEHFWARLNPLSDIWRTIRMLDLEIEALRTAIELKARNLEVSKKKLQELVKQKESELERNARLLSAFDEKLKKEFASQAATFFRENLPVALGILLGLILAPIGIKAFFFFVIAPWASGRPPICLLPAASGNIHPVSGDPKAENGRGRISAVSVPVVLDPHQELLIQPEYLQSSALHARKETQWLLNSRIPFASLLSGMFLLTRVSPAGSEQVVVSATRDPLSEVGIVDLAEGAAFVCQPRSLAGVIQDRRNPIRITRHWRLGSLHSWLTLQLRFLVFHGPGQLVMRGCRGIRIESVGTGRLINQAATLGFSANVGYGNIRCETFLSYWTGQEDLFNDLFTGGPGVYVYEEMPNAKRAVGITGRGIEGFADTVLKAFGV